jgi:3-deoxy-manno-octulosonate cytidylyltransferase (CMP-KDO synthetase)
VRLASLSSPTAPRAARVSIVAIIPARYASTRLPGKLLLDLAGKPLVQHVYERVARCDVIDRVIVATDDARIARVVEGFGGTVLMTRADHPSGTDRLAEAAASLDAEVVVNVQGDEPLVEPAMIAELVGPFQADATVQMTTLARRLTRPEDYASPHVVKVVVDARGDALYFSRAPIPHARDLGAGEGWASAWKHLGLYAYRRAFLLEVARLAPTPLERLESLEQLRVLEHGHRIRVVETAFDSIGVDTADDLARVRERLHAHLAR